MRAALSFFLAAAMALAVVQAQIELPTLKNCAKATTSIGAANETNTDLLHTLLSTNWKNCAGTIIFTEPGAVFVLPGGYISMIGNVILDASALASPVTLTSTIGKLFAMTTKGSAFVAKNIDFANNARQAFIKSDTATTVGNIVGNVLFVNGGMASFESCRFSNNTIDVIGAAGVNVGAGGGALRFAACTYVRFDDCSFEGNSVTVESRFAYGGAVSILNPVGPSIFNRCTFVGNKVATTYTINGGRSFTCGGAVFAESQPPSPANQTVTFTSCAFQNNEARGVASPALTGLAGYHVAGAAVATEPMAVKATLLDFTYLNCSFVGNTVAASSVDPSSTIAIYVYGGALSHTFSTVNVTSSTFHDNAAINSGYTTAQINSAANYRAFGGAVFFNGILATIDSSVFVNNTASAAVDARGGGLSSQLHVVTAGVGPFMNTLAISNTTWIDNKVLVTGDYGRTAYGGAYAMTCHSNQAYPCLMSTSTSTLANNSASLVGTTVGVAAFAQGGGIYISQMSLGATLTDVSLSGNQVYGEAGGALSNVLNVEGGGLYLLDTVASLTGTDFATNTAEIASTNTAGNSLVDGGGLTIATGAPTTIYASKVDLTRATFRDNTAGGIKRYFGGALFSYFKSVLVDVETDLVAMDSMTDSSFFSFNEWSIATTSGTSKVITTRSTRAPTTEPTPSPTLVVAEEAAAAVDESAVTMEPSAQPSSAQPSASPSDSPSVAPTSSPSDSPTPSPSPGPTSSPYSEPTSSPSSGPTASPSPEPTSSPSPGPTFSPSDSPTSSPSPRPTTGPSGSPTPAPSPFPKSPSATPPSVSVATNEVSAAATTTTTATTATTAKTAEVSSPSPTRRTKTKRPTRMPKTRAPTAKKTRRPTPTRAPTAKKTRRPTKAPTRKPRRKKPRGKKPKHT